MSRTATGYTGRHRRRSFRAVIVGALVTLAAVAALVVNGAYGAYLARVTNSTNTAATNPYFTCTAAAVGETATKAYFAWPLSEGTALATASDATGNGRTGTYSATGTSRAASDNGTGPVCRRDPLFVTAFDGANGSVSPNALTAAVAGPTVFSVEVWFRTSSPQGKLIGFGSSRTGASGSYDRHLYINTAGNLVFGVYPNQIVTVTSSAIVTDGQWHHAVGTVSSNGTILYLDGKQVASTGNTGTQSFSGWWRVGYDNLASWPGAAANYYFKGSLAYAAVYSYALTAAQVQSHFVAGD